MTATTELEGQLSKALEDKELRALVTPLLVKDCPTGVDKALRWCETFAHIARWDGRHNGGRISDLIVSQGVDAAIVALRNQAPHAH